MDPARLRAAYEQVKRELLAERTEEGHWVGELSSSALSTATAVSALAVVRRVQGSGFRVQASEGRGEQASGGRQPPEVPSTFDLRPSILDELISRGVAYLVTQQNPDGGFGDTDLSHSNIATTYLVVAALHLAGVSGEHADLLARANAYIDSKGRLAGLRERYGVDKTFVAPIMTNLALAGLLDWREIDPLPFELACVPQSLYRFVGMPVVSYAIPALVAIGQARYHHAPPRNPITRLIRWLSITRSLKVLRCMQPDSGGYLEATPLTSFVVMSLASLHRSPHAPREEPAERNPKTTEGHITRSVMPTVANDVIRHGVKFLAASIRPDGSWPIDTNLATWNTTLAINALAGAGEDVAELLGPKCLDWLLSCQHTKRHPFTGADPGGFGWSDLSGAVPDADDTSGALLTLGHFGACADRELPTDWKLRQRVEVRRRRQYWVSIELAIAWVEGLQNRDGGWPTFCRGWGRLPFDRSGSDLTAHVMRALAAFPPEKRYRWKGEQEKVKLSHAKSIVDFSPSLQTRRRAHEQATSRGLRFISTRQHPAGSWSPLWFGNQDHPTEDNPVYGTAKVLFAYRDMGLMDSPEARRGVAWLVANQNADGGWGSGVWEKVRRTKDEGRNGAAEPGGAGGVESGQGVGDSGGTGGLPGTAYSVPSTQYSVLSTMYKAPAEPMPPLSPDPRAPTPLTSSVEETALAVEALLAVYPLSPEPRTLNPEPASAALEKGLTWLTLRVERGEHRQPAPIGFYFAKLWYYERLYPLTFTVAALGRACRQFAHPAQLDLHADPAPARAP